MACLSINETTTYRWSFEEDVTEYRAAGVGAIGVWRRKLSDFGEAKGADLLEEAGLVASCLSWVGGFTGSDGRSYAESLLDAHEALKTAAEINAPTVIVYSGGRAGHTYNHAKRLIKGALAELVPQAAEAGITLAVEPMHPGCADGWTFLTSLDETLDLLDAIGDDRVKFVFDAYHLGQRPDVLERIERIASRVALVQLGDAKKPPDGEQNRCQLGQGVVPLKQIVAALKAGGYDGYYDVELLGEDVESLDYRLLIDAAQRAYAELVV
ncbi:MAG TPA: sugar phosphate isomerase/epimerase family protein [Thermoguttaceae bacterium]|nr:sugar phosphate isomerase/epimerase family protein [Thermoguttaceae bacterium]